MKRLFRPRAAGALLALVLAAGAAAQPAKPPAAPETRPAAGLNEFLEDLFKKHGGRTLCVAADTPVDALRREVVEQLKTMGVGESAGMDQVEEAAWTRYPCPFPPQRAGLKEASSGEIEGVWLYPEASQGLRFGPKSNRRPATPSVAITCEIIGHYPDGEFRSGALVGEKACPFGKAADLEPARRRPRAFAWSMPRPGRLAISRTEDKAVLQEWDVYVVTAPFEHDEVRFAAGDLLAYLRERGAQPNAATEFRHLRRLR